MARVFPIVLALALGAAACSKQRPPDEPTPEERAALARLEAAKEEAVAEVQRVQKEALAELEAARNRALQAMPAAPAAPADAAAAGPPQPGSLTGQVLAKGTDRLSLRTPDGLQYDLNVSDEVEVFKGGRPVQWRTVQEGARVRASYRPAGNDFVVERVDVVEEAGARAAPPAPASPAPETAAPPAPAAPGGRSLPPEAPPAEATPPAPPPAENPPPGHPPDDRYRDD